MRPCDEVLVSERALMSMLQPVAQQIAEGRLVNATLLERGLETATSDSLNETSEERQRRRRRELGLKAG